MMFLLATTSLPAVDHPNTDRWNAADSCQNDYMKGDVHIATYNTQGAGHITLYGIFF